MTQAKVFANGSVEVTMVNDGVAPVVRPGWIGELIRGNTVSTIIQDIRSLLPGVPQTWTVGDPPSAGPLRIQFRDPSRMDRKMMLAQQGRQSDGSYLFS